MKKLTFSSMAAARLKANKRQYVSLVLGIFLSIFLISTLVLSVWGIYQAQLQMRYDTVGYLDMVILDHDQIEMVTEEDVFSTGDYDRLGYAYLSGVVTGRNVYVGYYDEVGAELLNLTALEGRLPENPGEIAMERTAMDVLDVDWKVGDSVELDITPIDGVEETRQFTLVGVLPERSVNLERIDYNFIGQFPAVITSSLEDPFDTGRIAYHYVLGFGKNGSISDSLKGFWDYYKGYRVGNAIYGLSITGEQVWWYGTGDFIQSNREMFVMILMACVLAGSLILSCAICIFLTMLLVLSMSVTAFAAEFEIDSHSTMDGMSRSWYQGYAPSISYHKMTLCLPIRAESCVGDIKVSLALDDPNVFVLSAPPKEVTVSPKDGIYPVKLVLPLEQYRRNGDYPATITIKGTDGDGKEIVKTFGYVIRIRDGYGSHETMEPVISDVVGNLDVGTDGSLSLTIANPTTTQSIKDGEITVTDSTGEILMTGSNRYLIPEILPGKSETVTIPMTVKGNASISQEYFL